MARTKVLASGKLAELDDTGRVVRIYADTTVEQAVESWSALQQAAVPQVEHAAGRAPKPDVRPNRYGGKCLDCGGYVAEGAGQLTGNKQVGYGVRHVGACPPKPERQAEPEGLAKGQIHVAGGRYYRIHVSQGTGKPYAVVANVLVPAVWEDGVCVRPGEVEWEYEPGLIRKYGLCPATQATAAQAKAFAQLAGRCVFCSTPIDTPESTAVGYGPVCARKRGLPWGATTEMVRMPMTGPGFGGVNPEHEAQDVTDA